jgi:hypothetical protein
MVEYLSYAALTVSNYIQARFQSERGAVSVEYVGLAVVAALIFGAIYAVLTGTEGLDIGAAFRNALNTILNINEG